MFHEVRHHSACHFLPVIEDWSRFFNEGNLHLFDFLFVFEELSDVWQLLFEKIEFFVCYGSVVTII